MQQRRLRLGDILDDYCPRERRITNHAVVAMIEDQVKQTRCTTCDADHEYKEARVPPPRRNKDAGVLADVVDEAPRAIRAADENGNHDHGDETLTDDFDSSPDNFEPDSESDHPRLGDAQFAAPRGAAEADPGLDEGAGDRLTQEEEPVPDETGDEGPVHRPLFRARLPRPEGQPPEWKEIGRAHV